MVLTVEQVQQRLESLYGGWLSEFKPLYEAVNEQKKQMFVRIYPRGNSSGKNTDGTELSSFKYSTTPIYVSATIAGNRGSIQSTKTGRSVKNKTANSQFTGTQSKEIKSRYFAGGYSQLKQEMGRPPLELTGFLKGAFFDEELVANGLVASINLPDSQSGKIEGLQSKYGVIFQPTEDEEKEFLELHAQLVIDSINDSLK